MERLLQDKKKRFIIIGVAVVFILYVFFIKPYTSENNTNTSNDVSNPSSESIPVELLGENHIEELEEPIVVYVDIKGAVLKPGVYQLEGDSRVQDAIEMAGGFVEEANQAQINLAARVEDEMVIFVPEMGEGEQSIVDYNQVLSKPSDGLININKATADQLQQLPGIGASKAATIITYREENGPFMRVEDLVNVSGIGEKSLQQFKNQITVR